MNKKNKKEITVGKTYTVALSVTFAERAKKRKKLRSVKHIALSATFAERAK